MENFIGEQKKDLRSLEKDRILQYEIPVEEVWNQALEIIPDGEIAMEILMNAVNRLKIRIIDWDSDRCKKCQMCIPDCPTDAISFDYENDTIVRYNDKCLRCSICYQTCPFSVIKYFLAKFSLEANEDGDEIIYITVKASNLSSEIVVD